MYKTKKLHYSSFLLAFIALFFCGKDALAMIPVETRVDKISAIKTAAISDNTYDKGFNWLIDVTIPDNETFVSMKFDDLKFGLSKIHVAKNLRYYSRQSKNATSSAEAMFIAEAGAYGENLEIEPAIDLDNTKPGIQVKIEVEIAVPKESLAGSYSFAYSLKSEDKTPPKIIIGDYVKTPTNKDITVTATVNEGRLNEVAHVFKENGTFTFEAVDEKGNVGSTTVVINNIDKNPPSLTLKGDNPITVERYSIFKEPGYNTSDSENRIKNYRSDRRLLNMKSIGEYLIYYYAEDMAGNTSTTTRLVRVVDTTPPEIVISQFNKELTNQNIEVAASVIDGTLDVDRHIFTQNGSFTFTAIDDVGNSTSTTVTINNIDKEKPKIILDGDNPMVFEVDEFEVPVTSAKVVDNNPVPENSVLIDFGNLDWSTVGDYKIKYNAKDIAGNQAGEVVRDVHVVDTRPPIIRINDFNKETPTNKDILVSATVFYGKLNTTSHTFTQNGSFDFIATDEVGNVSSTTVTVTNIDKTAPVLTLLGGGIVGHERGTRFDDPFVKISDNNPIDLNAVIVDLSNFDKDRVGDYNILYYAKDAAGNEADMLARFVSVRDHTPPKITILDYNKNPTRDSILVRAVLDEGRFTSHTQMTFNKNGRYTFSAIDDSGNTSSSTVFVTNIDNTPPVINYSSSTNVLERLSRFEDLSLSCIDPIDSYGFSAGVDVCRAKFDDISNEVITDPNYPYYYDIIATDKLGNTSYAKRKFVIVDKTAPVITTKANIDTPTRQNVVITATVNEGSVTPENCTLVSNNESCTFKAVDDYGNRSEKIVTINNIDNEVPVISLKGNSVYEMFEGDSYVELGATVSDNLTKNIIPIIDPNSFDSSKIGKYNIIYNATDEAGNRAVPVSREVIIKEKIVLQYENK